MTHGREERVAQSLQLHKVRVLLLSLLRCVPDVSLRVDDEDLRLVHASALPITTTPSSHNVTLLVRGPVSEASHERTAIRGKCVVDRPQHGDLELLPLTPLPHTHLRLATHHLANQRRECPVGAANNRAFGHVHAVLLDALQIVPRVLHLTHRASRQVQHHIPVAL